MRRGDQVKNQRKFVELLAFRERLVLISFSILIAVFCVTAEQNVSAITTDASVEPASWDTSDDKRIECPKHTYNRTCCNHDEFQCADGHCVPSNKVCNTKYDCPDDSDEDGCLGLPCSSRLHLKCEQTCRDSPGNKSRCMCFKGYSLRKTTFKQSCKDINECEIGVHLCTHDCENLNGTFRCKCREGFEKDEETNNCRANDQNIQVLYSSDSWIYSYNVEKHKVSPVVHVGKVDEMDYDPANNIIYWSSRHRMARSFLPGAKDGWVTVGYPQMVGPTSIWHIKNSLAIDWTAGNLYWISVDILNMEKYQILVSKLDGRYVKTLVDNVLAASSLVVDPENGKMYWTSGGEKPEIGAAWMNGMYRRTLLSLESNHEPTALTLDHLSNGRLYWADSKSHSLYSIFTDGTRPSKIITLSADQSPLMMDVFENYLYWVTRESNQLVKLDKFGRGNVIPLVEHLINQTAVKVYHPRRVEVEIRKAALYCSQQCSHLCLHVPRGYSCSCPDGSRLLLLMGEILCDAEREEPLDEPLTCNCEDKDKVCNTTSPYHKCHCPHVKCLDGQELPEHDDYVDTSESDLEVASFNDNSKWNKIVILLLCITPVFICFGLSFCKRRERIIVQAPSDQLAFNRPIGFSGEDSSITEGYLQGGPTIVKSSGAPQRNNGLDNPLYQIQDSSDFQSTTQLLVP